VCVVQKTIPAQAAATPQTHTAQVAANKEQRTYIQKTKKFFQFFFRNHFSLFTSRCVASPCISGGCAAKWAAVCHLTKRFCRKKEYLNNSLLVCLQCSIGGGYAALLCLFMYCEG
jgi:hypothetical protein